MLVFQTCLCFGLWFQPVVTDYCGARSVPHRFDLRSKRFVGFVGPCDAWRLGPMPVACFNSSQRLHRIMLRPLRHRQTKGAATVRASSVSVLLASSMTSACTARSTLGLLPNTKPCSASERCAVENTSGRRAPTIASPLGRLTTPAMLRHNVSVKAILLVRDRATHSDGVFSELVVWQVPVPVSGSLHSFKYRLALVVRGACLLRYDNEVGKGNHRHGPEGESEYNFVSLERLFVDFEREVRRLLDEDGNS